MFCINKNLFFLQGVYYRPIDEALQAVGEFRTNQKQVCLSILFWARVKLQIDDFDKTDNIDVIRRRFSIRSHNNLSLIAQ